MAGDESGTDLDDSEDHPLIPPSSELDVNDSDILFTELKIL